MPLCRILLLLHALFSTHPPSESFNSRKLTSGIGCSRKLISPILHRIGAEVLRERIVREVEARMDLDELEEPRPNLSTSIV